jgi:agmatinase
MTPATDTFLGLAGERARLEGARYVVLPVPYEGTVSYKSGAAAGPQAVIEASRQLDPFDEELRADCSRAGIATAKPVHPAPGPEEQMRRVTAAAGPVLEAGKFLLTLGGEHSITAPLVAAAAAAHADLSVLQIDAHADLRDSCDGSRHSHACVMRRVLETGAAICQVGVRSYSKAEYDECREQIERLITPAMIGAHADWIDRALARLTANVYVTIDMDGLDPSIAPGVGTPEPGGLTWAQVTSLLRRVCRERRVVAADLVETRPIPPSIVTEGAAAHLACKIIAYTQR